MLVFIRRGGLYALPSGGNKSRPYAVFDDTEFHLYSHRQEAVKKTKADLATRSDLAILKADLERHIEVLKADLGR